MEDDEFSGDIFEWNTYTIINYIKAHYVQFLLLIAVFIIIYVVDRISNINSLLFAIPSAIPGLPAQTSQNVINAKIKKPKKLKK